MADEQQPATEPDFVWKIVKAEDSGITFTLGERFADLSDAQLTFLMRKIGEGLIKLGTQFLQSRVGGDDEDDEPWD